MGALILAAFLAALFAGTIVLGFSVGLAWIGSRLLHDVSHPKVALASSGVVPVLFTLWTVAGFVPDGCCESGTEAQGLLIAVVVLAGLLFVAWLVGFRINSRLLSARS